MEQPWRGSPVLRATAKALPRASEQASDWGRGPECDPCALLAACRDLDQAKCSPESSEEFVKPRFLPEHLILGTLATGAHPPHIPRMVHC